MDSYGTKIKLLGAKLKGKYDYYCQVLIDKIVKNFPDLQEDDQLILHHPLGMGLRHHVVGKKC